mmetsp:Transcript_6408/g.11086  ORF Transcript_6408/g.11086 Transcript_6408/m.11086 type:complete len:223 (+) Transcript_6408:159-827(+)
MEDIAFGEIARPKPSSDPLPPMAPEMISVPLVLILRMNTSGLQHVPLRRTLLVSSYTIFSAPAYRSTNPPKVTLSVKLPVTHSSLFASTPSALAIAGPDACPCPITHITPPTLAETRITQRSAVKPLRYSTLDPKVAGLEVCDPPTYTPNPSSSSVSATARPVSAPLPPAAMVHCTTPLGVNFMTKMSVSPAALPAPLITFSQTLQVGEPKVAIWDPQAPVT